MGGGEVAVPAPLSGERYAEGGTGWRFWRCNRYLRGSETTETLKEVQEREGERNRGSLRSARARERERSGERSEAQERAWKFFEPTRQL